MKRFLVAICFAALPVAAHAVIITYASRAAFDAAFPGSVVENWDGFAAGTVFPDGTTANGITYTSSAGNAVVTNVFSHDNVTERTGRHLRRFLRQRRHDPVRICQPAVGVWG